MQTRGSTGLFPAHPYGCTGDRELFYSKKSTIILNQLSIITTTYNSADTLAGCIKSVLSQTQSVEHIVIDGASSDATPVILDQYKDHLAQVVSEPDRGMYD